MSSQIRNTLSTYSRIETSIGTVIFGIIVIVFIFIGISMVRNNRSESVSGKVLTSVCSTSGNNQGYNCNLTIEYTVKGRSYTLQTSETSNTAYSPGSKVNLIYDPSNPEDAIISQSTRLIGIVIIIISVILGIIAAVRLYFVLKSDSYAEITGGISAIGATSDAIFGRNR